MPWASSRSDSRLLLLNGRRRLRLYSCYCRRSSRHHPAKRHSPLALLSWRHQDFMRIYLSNSRRFSILSRYVAECPFSPRLFSSVHYEYLVNPIFRRPCESGQSQPARSPAWSWRHDGHQAHRRGRAGWGWKPNSQAGTAATHYDRHFVRSQRQRHERLAVGILAKRRSMLWRHANRVISLLGQRRVIDDQPRIVRAKLPTVSSIPISSSSTSRDICRSAPQVVRCSSIC